MFSIFTPCSRLKPFTVDDDTNPLMGWILRRKSLVTYSEDQFIRSAVAVATDVDLNARSREFILANNHR